MNSEPIPEEDYLILQKYNRLGATRPATVEEEFDFLNHYSELSHLTYLSGSCQDLYEDASLLHKEMQYMPLQDFLELKHKAILAGMPNAYALSRDILMQKCNLDSPEYNNDNLLSSQQKGGALTFELLNPTDCKKTKDCIPASAPQPARRLNLAEKLIWLFKLTAHIPPTKRLEIFIEALVFDEDIEFNAATSKLSIIKTAEGKIAKLCFKQPTHGSIEHFALSDDIPDKLKSQQIAYKKINPSPFSDDLTTLTSISPRPFQAINVRDIQVGGVNHATIRYITNKNTANGHGFTEGSPIYYGTYYATKLGKEMLLASAILRILYYLEFKYFLTETKAHKDSFKAQFEQLFDIPNFFKPAEKTFVQLVDYGRTTEQVNAELLRLDLFYLLLGKDASGTFGASLSMNPLMGDLHTTILSLMKKLKITTSYVGAKESAVRTDYPNAKSDFKEETVFGGLGNKMDVTPIVVDHLGPTGYRKNADGTDISCLEITKTEYTLNNDILPIIKTRSETNDHVYCAIMSQLVYMSQDIVIPFFKPDQCIYLGGFDEDPDWKINDVSIKHRVHAWYQKLSTTSYKIYIAVRGSHTTRDWVHADYNISAGTVQWYEERVLHMPTIIKNIQQAFANAVNKTPLTRDITVKIVSCGHSLGGLMALMFSYTSLIKPLTNRVVRNHFNIKFADYIYPIVFNPFCGSHHSVYTSLKLLPCGHVYRVWGDLTGARYKCEDAASSMFSRPSSEFNLSVVQVFHSSWRLNNELCKSRSFIETMTDAHIMFQFIGVLWAYIESLEHCRIKDGKRIECLNAVISSPPAIVAFIIDPLAIARDAMKTCTRGANIQFKDIDCVKPFYKEYVAPASPGFAEAIASAAAMHALLSAEAENIEIEEVGANEFVPVPGMQPPTLFYYPDILFVQVEGSSFEISEDLKSYLNRAGGGDTQRHLIAIINAAGVLQMYTLNTFQKNAAGVWSITPVRAVTVVDAPTTSVGGVYHKKRNNAKTRRRYKRNF